MLKHIGDRPGRALKDAGRARARGQSAVVITTGKASNPIAASRQCGFAPEHRQDDQGGPDDQAGGGTNRTDPAARAGRRAHVPF
jgi:hypothetical protein